MALWILRVIFLLVAIGMGAASSNLDIPTSARWFIFFAYLITAVLIVVLDIAIKRKRIDMISSVYFGLVVGLFLTYVAGLVLTPLFKS